MCPSLGLSGHSLVRGRILSDRDEQRRHLDEPRGSARRDRHPAEIGQEEPTVAGPVLPADVDRDVVALEPRAGGVPNLAVLARGMADDLRQERIVVPVVVHLPEVRRKNTSGLVPDLAWQTSLLRMARPDVENLMRQVASRDSLPLDEHAAKHVVHVRRDRLGSACALFAHREIDDVRQDASVDEELAVIEIRRGHDQPGVSLGVQAASLMVGQSRYPRDSSPP